MNKKKKILAISSGGGHWVQLRRLQPAFYGCEIIYSTVNLDLKSDVAGHQFYRITDATRWNKLLLIKMMCQILLIIYKERPDVVISTGAAPGYFAIRIGNVFGAKTIWLDSIANVEELSLTGKKLKKYANLCLTQWEHVAEKEGVIFGGKVF